MKKAFLLIPVTLLLNSLAWASSLQCRGVDGLGHQVAVQVRDISTDKSEITRASLRVVSLKVFGGRKDICKEALVSGNANSQFSVACQTNEGSFALTLKIKATNKYVGTFCGNRPGTEIAGLEFAEAACLELSCSTTGL